MARPHDEVILWINSYSALAPFSPLDGSGSKTGETTAPAPPEQPCPAIIEGPYPLKKTWLGSLFGFVCGCAWPADDFYIPVPPAPITAAAEPSPSAPDHIVIDILPSISISTDEPFSPVPSSDAEVSSSAPVDTPSATEEPPSPDASDPAELGNIGVPDTPSCTEAPPSPVASETEPSIPDTPSGSASATEDDDEIMAAPRRAPTVIPAPAQNTAVATAAVDTNATVAADNNATPAGDDTPAADNNATHAAADTDTSPAAADTSAPTHKPTRRGGRAGKVVQARRRRAAERAAQQQAEEAAGQQA